MSWWSGGHETRQPRPPPRPPRRLPTHSKPFRYVTHCLGHEGPGSLLDVLQGEGWAESVSAGVSLMNDDCHAFKIGVILTEAGEANFDRVMDLVL